MIFNIDICYMLMFPCCCCTQTDRGVLRHENLSGYQVNKRNRYAKAYMCLVQAGCLHVLRIFCGVQLFRSIPIKADLLQLKWKQHVPGIT